MRIDGAYRTLRAMNDKIIFVCERVLIVLISAIVVILFASVVWRYILFNPISWSADAALICVIWMTLLGAPVGMRGGHVAVTGVLELLPNAVQPWLVALINLAILASSAIVVWYGTLLTIQGTARIVPSIEWLNQGYLYGALPFGFALIIPLCIENVLKPFGYGSSPSDGISSQSGVGS